MNLTSIKNKIHSIRSKQVILDSDLAVLYGVKTKVLNQAVKRNISRFPDDFMFRLTVSENTELVTVCDRLANLKHSTSLPLVFTEQGIAMLSGVLKSDLAVKVNIQIMRAFISMRQFLQNIPSHCEMNDYILNKLHFHDSQISELFSLNTMDCLPKQGILFEDQTFDAYSLVSKIIRSASSSIVLIDNYVDETVLTLLTKRKKAVQVTIYTKNLTPQFKLDVEKHNTQYSPISLKKFSKSHDRFLIIDNKEVYHFGASLKDLGKKWFAFSKFDKEVLSIISRLDDFKKKTLK